MKKKTAIAACLALAAASSVSAEPLFPFFVDLVGVYDDISGTGNHLIGGTDGGGRQACEIFLADTLPESYGVSEDTRTVGATTIHSYSSKMADGSLSVIYLIDAPAGFHIEYSELADELYHVSYP